MAIVYHLYHRMPIIPHTISCTKKEVIAPNVFELRFSKPANFTFKPGQFVLFDVPLISDPKNIQARAYSIASSPDEAELIFGIKLTPGGRASEWIEKILDVGSQVIMKGPFGVFVLDEKTDKGYVFISTGAGVAPFRSQVRWALLEAKDKRPIELIFGVREKSDLFWADEFSALMKQYPNFRFHISLTSAEPDWDGHRGRVQVVAPQVMGDAKKWKVYICGAPEMVGDVKKKCLEEWGLEKRDVHAEGYI